MCCFGFLPLPFTNILLSSWPLFINTSHNSHASFGKSSRGSCISHTVAGKRDYEQVNANRVLWKRESLKKKFSFSLPYQEQALENLAH